MKYKTGLSIVGLFVVVAIFYYFSTREPSEYKIDRMLKYSISVSNPTNKLIERANFWIYLPVKLTSTQMFVTAEASHNYRLDSDELGNQRMVFELQDIPPYGSKIISIMTKIKMSQYPNPMSLDSNQAYLNAEKNIESDHPLVVETAKTINKKDKMDTAKAIYFWMLENMKYTGFISEDRGAIFALKHRSGDCTEYACLYTALSRASRIPSRVMAGFAYGENAKIAIQDYHNWSEVYVQGRWWLVDSQREVFMDDLDKYIAMRVIGSGNSDVNSQKYFHVDAPLMAKMN